MRNVIALSFLLLSAACSDRVAAPAACLPETGSVQATIKSTANGIVFDWQPACAVALVLVEEDASDMWAAMAPNLDANATDVQNIIRPPVTYGQVPAGAEEGAPALTLAPGKTYELVLWKVVSPGTSLTCQQRFSNACLLAVKPFTR